MIPLSSVPEQQIIAGVSEGAEKARIETNVLTLLKLSTADASLSEWLEVSKGKAYV